MNNDFEKMKKQKALRYTILQTTGLFAILIIGGCFDWLNMKFAPEQILTWTYWNNVIVQVLMYTIALFIGYIGRLEKEELSNEEYELSMNLYHQYFIQKAESFIKFINQVINPRIREEYYKAYIENKLYKLEKRNQKKDVWKLEYDRALTWLTSDFKNNIQNYELSDLILKNKKACKEYIKNRYALELLNQDENIKSNAKTFNQYPRVNAHAFTWGVRTKDNKKGGYKVESEVAKDISGKLTLNVLRILFTSILLGTILADASGNELLEQANGWLKLLIIYFIRVAGSIWSYIRGHYMGREIFEADFLDVINNRNVILEEYINWKSAQNETETEGYKIKKLYLESLSKPKEEKAAEPTTIDSKEIEAQESAKELLNRALS